MMQRIILFLAVLSLAGQSELRAQTSGNSFDEPDGSAATISHLSRTDSAAIDEVRALIREQAEQLELQRRQLDRQEAEIEELRRQVVLQRHAPISTADQEGGAAYDAALLRTA